MLGGRAHDAPNTAHHTAIQHKNLLYGSIQHNRRVTRPLYGYTAMQRNAPYSNTAPYIIQHNTIPLRYLENPCNTIRRSSVQ